MAKITIFGLAGVGKSVVGKRLADDLKFNFLSGGDMARKTARDLGYEFYAFEEMCRTNLVYDKERDEYIAKFGKENDNFVLESRLGWRFIPDSVKIRLACDFDARIKRLAARECIPFDEAKQKTIAREESANERYAKLYGISLSDLSEDSFDLTVDTTNILPDEVIQRIHKFLSNS
ncbi:hypothetical protein C4572_01315 [Candidatus Parcubacteria bacterium]|nr:MAG: hypothetical protein C4572_01315 [Candidatus Parcubacteria bacterium]